MSSNNVDVPVRSSPGPSPSPVDFPSSDPLSHSSNMHYPRPPYLPFRRISVPSAPNLLHRQSVVSVASFDSLPEDRSPPGAAMPAAMKSAARKSKGRPASLEAMRRGSRTRHVRHVDEARESKRRKAIHEFYETERSYVDGLELIYSHFLTPIIASLDTPQPLLDRAELTSVFSNFIDIWNLHRSFFSSLSSLLNTSASTTTQSQLPPLSPILLSHFPYLSLYTPFVTAFPTALSSLTTLLTHDSPFATFVAQQEADERCGKLKLRDWLLTIVQRCPRYLLLLKDLIGCTEPDDSEHTQLMAVHTLVSKITLSLNTSLHSHAQTLSLLALQRSTPNLPFQLISPGRTFLKRGSLLQLEHSSSPKEREFLLFSDCILWLASADKSDSDLGDKWEWGGGAPANKGKSAIGGRPGLARSRSKSEAELPTLKAKAAAKEAGSAWISKSNISASPKKKARHASSGTEDRWVYKGHTELVDLEVVVSPQRDPGDERRLEILSPETSFAVYAENERERDEWGTAIRTAKASQLVSLNVTHPNSTLTSSSSTAHLRRSLQALPHLPQDDQRKPRRGKVEHFVPAIWIPDGKTESCMRCGRTFGWRRRRHHCRLCGRCVCGSCSTKTFFILDSKSKDSTKSARSCDACYETVFPLLEQGGSAHMDVPSSQTNSTLSGFPSWLSMPSLGLPTDRWQPSTPEALMAIDIGQPRRALHRIDDEGSGVFGGELTDNGNARDGSSAVSRIRPKPVVRPRSYHQILEDFQYQEERSPGWSNDSQVSAKSNDPGSSAPSQDPLPIRVIPPSEDDSGGDHSSATASLPPSPRKEDTVRRHKRFSLPAVALQTTAVTARPNATGEGRAKRFSLVLSGRSSGSQAQRRNEEGEGKREAHLGDGVAAGKLSELLGKRK